MLATENQEQSHEQLRDYNYSDEIFFVIFGGLIVADFGNLIPLDIVCMLELALFVGIIFDELKYKVLFGKHHTGLFGASIALTAFCVLILSCRLYASEAANWIIRILFVFSFWLIFKVVIWYALKMETGEGAS